MCIWWVQSQWVGLEMDVDVCHWFQQAWVLCQQSHRRKIKLDWFQYRFPQQQIRRLPLPQWKNLPNWRDQLQNRLISPSWKEHHHHVLFFLIILSATKPEFEVNFEIMHRTAVNKDMGILKTDMVKGEGHFVGHIIDPEDSTKKI